MLSTIGLDRRRFGGPTAPRNSTAPRVDRVASRMALLLSRETEPRFRLMAGTPETSSWSARGPNFAQPAFAAFPSTLLPGSGCLPTSALLSMGFNQLAGLRRRSWAMSEALDGFGCAVTLPDDPSQAVVSTSFVSLQKAAAVARPNRWRTSILRDDAFLSTTAVVNEVPGPATCPVLAHGAAYLRCFQVTCGSAVRMEVPPFAWLRADTKLIPFGSVSATCVCGHFQLVCGSCWRTFDGGSRVGHVCEPATSAGVIVLPGAPEHAPVCECGTLRVTNAVGYQQMQAATSRNVPTAPPHTIVTANVQELPVPVWHPQRRGPMDQFFPPPVPRVPSKSSKRPRQVTAEPIPADAGDVPFELPDRSPRPEPDKPKQSESGPNKMDIKNCIATMGFNTIQRKALLRLALAWAERLPTSTSKRNLVAKLSMPMSATHKWGRRCKPELRLCWTIVATLFPEFLMGGRVPIIDFAHVSSVNQMISPVKMPDAVHRVPTLEIAARLACALADAGVAETFDFASTRNGYKLDTGNGDDDEYRSE